MIIIIHINLHGNQLYCLVHVERLIWEVILHVLQCSREAVLLNGVHGLLEWDVNKIRHTNLRSGLSSPRSGLSCCKIRFVLSVHILISILKAAVNFSPANFEGASSSQLTVLTACSQDQERVQNAGYFVHSSC